MGVIRQMEEKQKNIEFTGVWIPKEIWEMQDLNLIEKCFLAVIHSLNSNDKECIASNKWFAEFFGITRKHASRVINSLAAKQKISVCKIADTLRKIADTPSAKLQNPPPQKCGTPLRKNADHIIKKNNIDYNKDDINPDFIPIIDLWLKYKKEKRQSYKSDMSIKTFIDQLNDFSDGSPETAKKIINASIANNWAGIFPPDKRKINGNEQLATAAEHAADVL
jgi:hypothetical protein